MANHHASLSLSREPPTQVVKVAAGKRTQSELEERILQLLSFPHALLDNTNLNTNQQTLFLHNHRRW